MRRKGVGDTLPPLVQALFPYVDGVRMLKRVDSIRTISIDFISNSTCHCRRIRQLDSGWMRTFTVAVHNSDGKLMFRCVTGHRDIKELKRSQVCNAVRPRSSFVIRRQGICFAVDIDIQGCFLRAFTEEARRVVSRLKEQSIFIGKDGCYNIDELSKVGDFNCVTVTYEGVQVACDGQGIGQGILLFQPRFRFAHPEPDIPLVIRNMDWMSNFLVVTNKIDHRLAVAQGSLRLVDSEDVVVVVGTASIEVNAVITDERCQPFQYDAVPV